MAIHDGRFDYNRTIDPLITHGRPPYYVEESEDDDDHDINWLAVFSLALLLDAIVIGAIVFLVRGCSA